MNCLIRHVLQCLALLLLLSSSHALAEPLEKVRLQLKWFHQFQFAGYYAAQAQGYYRDAGLEVELVEAKADGSAIQSVLSGQAEFGIGNVDILLSRMEGKPLVALAAIFQHSPHILLSKKSSNINSPADFERKRIMLEAGHRDVQHRALLHKHGLDMQRVTILPHSRNLQDLIDDKVDVISAYATVEPHLMSALGIDTAILATKDYGIDFYGDTLFTSEAQIAEHPELVHGFVRASLKGWRYALEHPHEIAELIMQLPGLKERGFTESQLLREARDMQGYILPDVIEIGHMNTARWEFIANVMAENGLVKTDSDSRLDGFIYESPKHHPQLMRWIFWGAIAVGSIMALVLLWNFQIRRRVRERTQALHAEIQHRQLVEKELQSSQEQVQSTFHAAAAGIATVSIDGYFLLVNPAFCEVVGYSEGELKGLHCKHLNYDEDSLDARKNRERLLNNEISHSTVEKRFRTKAGRPVWVRVTATLIRSADGSPHNLIKVVENIDDQKRQENLQTEQRYLLERIAAGAEPDDILWSIVKLIETQFPEVMGSIVLLEKDGTFGRCIASKLPQAYLQKLHGLQIGPSVGSCGTAAYERRTVVVADIQQDPLWMSYRYMAQQNGLRACWSMPILSSNQQVLGTFGVYGREPRTPGPSEMALVSACSHIAGIAIERSQSEEQLRLLETSVARLNDIVLIAEADPHGVKSPRIIFVNKAFERLMGYRAEEVLGKEPRLLDGPNTQMEEMRRIKTLLKQGESVRTELINYKKNGDEIWLEMDILPIANSAGVFTHWVSVERDITERKAAESKIKHLAFYDMLTNLPNRLLLLDRLEQALLNSSRLKRSGALLFLDLDNFKTLNDTHGHDFGDMLLEQVAQRLLGSVRITDTVARLGGDEFVVVLENLSEQSHDAAQEVNNIAEKVLVALSQPFQLAGYEHYSSCSIGVAMFGNDQAVTVDELLKRADLAMYEAKAAGRNTFRFFDPAMQALITKRAAMEEDLRQALRRDEMSLFYQPQVDAEGQLLGAEALLRWEHPTQGLLSPSGFIDLAEESGLILPIGEWVMLDACKQLVAWADNPKTTNLSLSVNVSARQLHQHDFIDRVFSILKATGANPQCLKLELTESMLVENIEEIIVKMNTLKAMGVGFAMDDFGTGYSSLSYLKRLPLSQIKIDRSFVRDLLIDSNDASIVQTIIALGHGLGLKVVAEGVETREQQNVLAAYGCLAYQGYLFGKPKPLEQFEQEFGLA